MAVLYGMYVWADSAWQATDSPLPAQTARPHAWLWCAAGTAATPAHSVAAPGTHGQWPLHAMRGSRRWAGAPTHTHTLTLHGMRAFSSRGRGRRPRQRRLSRGLPAGSPPARPRPAPAQTALRRTPRPRPAGGVCIPLCAPAPRMANSCATAARQRSQGADTAMGLKVQSTAWLPQHSIQPSWPGHGHCCPRALTRLLTALPPCLSRPHITTLECCPDGTCSAGPGVQAGGSSCHCMRGRPCAGCLQGVGKGV